MQIVYNQADLKKYMREAVVASPERPVLVDHYLIGQELEVDAICDGETVLIPGIMEHIERAGVHSGDSIAVYPPQNLSDELDQNNRRLHDPCGARPEHDRISGTSSSSLVKASSTSSK